MGLLVLALMVNADEYKCFTMVKNGTDVLQINPKQEIIPLVGLVDYFTPQPTDSKYQYVRVYFTTTDLRHQKSVNFSVVCSGNNQTLTFERSITPQIKTAEETIDWVIWLKANMTYLVVGLFIILFIVLGAIIIIRAMQ